MSTPESTPESTPQNAEADGPVAAPEANAPEAPATPDAPAAPETPAAIAPAGDAAVLAAALAAGDPVAPPAPELTPEMAKRRKRNRVLLLAGLSIVAVGIAALSLIAGWYGHTRKPLTALPALTQEAPHYLFSIYGTDHPLGVAISPSGEKIYVAESDGKRLVHVYDREGKETGVLRPPAGDKGGHIPVYVAVDPTNGEVYVTDRVSAKVYVYDTKNAYARTFTPKGLTGGFAPLGVAVGADSRVYVTDVTGTTHRLLEFQHDGTLVHAIGAPGELLYPNGVAVTSKGVVEVADSNHGRVVFFGADGASVASIERGVAEGDLGLPRGVALDDSGRLFVVDTANHAVRLYRLGNAKAPLPQYVASFGEEGTVDGTFEYPNGIATDTRARIYVTDRENNRVQVWSF